MTRPQCEKFAKIYLDWVRQGVNVALVGEVCEITTPFLDRHNDHVQIYVSQQNGAVFFSDDGQALSELGPSSTYSSPRIDEIVHGLGVERRGTRLEIESTEGNAGRAIHALVQAIVAVNYTLAVPEVGKVQVPRPYAVKAPPFRDEVRTYLDSHRVGYRLSAVLKGKSGLTHKIDFLIPRPSNEPERLLQVINNFAGDSVGKNIFALTDVREARVRRPEAFALLNDRDRKVTIEVIGALEDHDVKPIRWRDRESFVSILAG